MKIPANTVRRNYVIKFTPDNTRFTTDVNYAKKNLVFGNQESLQQP